MTSSDDALPSLPFTIDCSDFPLPFVSSLLLQLVRNLLLLSGEIEGSPKFLVYPFKIMPWSPTPEELVDTKTVYIVSKNTAFPTHEKGQPLRLYTVSGLNPFNLLIPNSLGLWPDPSFVPPFGASRFTPHVATTHREFRTALVVSL